RGKSACRRRIRVPAPDPGRSLGTVFAFCPCGHPSIPSSGRWSLSLWGCRGIAVCDGIEAELRTSWHDDPRPRNVYFSSAIQGGSVEQYPLMGPRLVLNAFWLMLCFTQR